MLDIEMPAKVKLLAMKTLLSAKLAEGKIIIVDNDYIPEKKTKLVDQSLKNFSSTDKFLFAVGYLSEDFKVASQNIHRLTYTTFDKLTLIDILKTDKLVFNLDGILNMMIYLHEKTVKQHKPRAVIFEGQMLKSMAEANQKGNKKAVEKVSEI
jgi:ribosomal protein L4